MLLIPRSVKILRRITEHRSDHNVAIMTALHFYDKSQRIRKDTRKQIGGGRQADLDYSSVDSGDEKLPSKLPSDQSLKSKRNEDDLLDQDEIERQLEIHRASKRIKTVRLEPISSIAGAVELPPSWSRSEHESPGIGTFECNHEDLRYRFARYHSARVE